MNIKLINLYTKAKKELPEKLLKQFSPVEQSLLRDFKLGQQYRVDFTKSLPPSISKNKIIMDEMSNSKKIRFYFYTEYLFLDILIRQTSSSIILYYQTKDIKDYMSRVAKYTEHYKELH